MVAEPVIVSHALGSYPVYVQAGALGEVPALVGDLLPGRRSVIIADASVHELYRTGKLGAPNWPAETLTFAPGESSKTRESWARLTDELTERGFGRDSGIIALGGG